MRRSYYAIIIFASIALALIAEASIIWSHGDNPLADMPRLIFGSIVWLVSIMIALLLIFFYVEENVRLSRASISSTKTNGRARRL
jgi:hypothetical protein